jgi:cytochrome c biogenesis protein CcdA
VSVGPAFLAGLLSILAPCILPLVPIVVGAATSQHRYGPVALVGGLTISFLFMGLTVASLGFVLDVTVVRTVGSLVLVGVGLAMLVPALQSQLATASGPLVNWTSQQLHGPLTRGLSGQFLVGLLLGIVWTPCVGPTLGAASVLAAQGVRMGEVATIMAAFSIGSALPLLLLGFLSREAFARLRSPLGIVGWTGKIVLGGALIITGVMILTGADRAVQTILLDALPQWMLELSARY